MVSKSKRRIINATPAIAMAATNSRSFHIFTAAGSDESLGN